MNHFSALSEQAINNFLLNRNKYLEINECVMNEPPLITQALMLLGIVQISILLGFCFVGLLVYNKGEGEDFGDDIFMSYEDNYMLDDYKDLVREDVDGLINTYRMENTPDGLVIMSYSKEDEGFLYWANKLVQYKYLETVARKYVIDNHCVNLYKGFEYIDVESDYESEEEEIVEKEEENSIFVKRKKSEKEERVKEIYVRNKYKMVGKIEDFNMMKDFVEKKEFSFEDFKKMNS